MALLRDHLKAETADAHARFSGQWIAIVIELVTRLDQAA
jgi:hypothetical protein